MKNFKEFAQISESQGPTRETSDPREQPVGRYNAPEVDNCFGTPQALATYNVSSYPLTKNGEIVSGQLGKGYDHSWKSKSKAHMNTFMGIGYESGGIYTLQPKHK